MNNSIIQEAKRYGVTNMNATTVDLMGENLTSIPKFVFSMPNLKKLMLTNNDFTRIPSDIEKLTSLKHLDLGMNKLTALPESIGNLTNLTFLGLNENRLSIVPSSIGNLTMLNGISLSDNKLTTLPESLGNLKNLEYLFIDENKLVSLPESIGNLKKLRQLNMYTVSTLKKIPDSFGQLPPNTLVLYNKKDYKPKGFMQLFKPRIKRTNSIRINNSTNIFNSSVMEGRLSNVAPNKRAFIKTKSNVKNNGTLRRIYNINGIMGYMKNKMYGRLHGNTFTPNKITLLKNVPFTVNKSAYLRNIKNRLTNASVNNMPNVIQTVKNSLPTNVTKTDVNRMAKNVARNKVKNTSTSNRNRVINTLKTKGLITNEDVKRLGN